MTLKTILITGANTGIGYETVKALLQSGKTYKIFLGARSPKKGDEAVEQVKKEVSDTKSSVESIQIDVTDDASIEAAAKKIERDVGHLDILVNNAGASFDRMIASGEMTPRQAWTASFDVNITGANIATEAFMPMLLKTSDPRVIFVTSGTSSLTESEDKDKMINKSPAAGWPKKDYFNIISYRSTKPALNMMMRQWSIMMANDNIKFFCVAPGFLATALNGADNKDQLKKMGAGEPKEGGISLRKVIEGERDADVGKVVRNYSTPVQPW